MNYRLEAYNSVYVCSHVLWASQAEVYQPVSTYSEEEMLNRLWLAPAALSVPHDGNTNTESFDFDEVESSAWKKNKQRRFYQDTGIWFNNTRTLEFKKWGLVITTGFVIACVGAIVIELTDAMTNYKFDYIRTQIQDNQWGVAFIAYVFINIFYAFLAGLLCVFQPAAAGSGIPEIKAFLNGINLNKVVSIPILICKILGMCFSVSSGLPLGKEGPMIHVGSIIGAVVSQGWTLHFGFDWLRTNFQDFRNDFTKRDFVSIGAAAGVAAAFKAPIGGILFVLEEGASFWSLSLTILAFICAAITELTISLIFANDTGDSRGLFAFGQFNTLQDGKSNYYSYELIVFLLIGAMGGAVGALFNHLAVKALLYRKKFLLGIRWRQVLELLVFTFLVSLVTFLLPLMWQVCSPVPSSTDSTAEEARLLHDLVQFQCHTGEYNQLASLYFTSADTAMQQLFHFREVDGGGMDSIGFGPIILFFIPYFFLAAITPGVFAPAGLFVPTLLSGAAFGRFWGHIFNNLFPGHVADAGTYAFIGAASILGGMSRMTISGTVILVEACGNTSYLLPLMVTFATARYVANYFNISLYETQLNIQKYPFLENEMKGMGLVNTLPVTSILSFPVTTLTEVESVKNVFEALTKTNHNGFPVLNKSGKLVGLVLRKTLCSLLKIKAFSSYASSDGTSGEAELLSHGAVFYDTIERNYPDYIRIEDINFTEEDMEKYLDLRPYADTAPYEVHESCTVQRCYKLFRTMGLRHLIVLDSNHSIKGMVTRSDLIEHRLEEVWHSQNGGSNGTSSGFNGDEGGMYPTSSLRDEGDDADYNDSRPLRRGSRTNSTLTTISLNV